MSLTHRLGRMSGRDPTEQHRTSTPLELFFDLTFDSICRIAFGVQMQQLGSKVS